MTVQIATGAHGWPLVPSKVFPGERTLSCPKCGGTSITLGVQYAPYGTGSRGQGRLGDPGALNYAKCGSCGETAWSKAKELGQ